MSHLLKANIFSRQRISSHKVIWNLGPRVVGAEAKVREKGCLFAVSSEAPTSRDGVTLRETVP